MKKLLAVVPVLVLCFIMTVTVEAATVKKPAKVTSVKASSVTATKTTIRYKKATRAKGYQIRYSTKSNMKSSKTVKTTKTKKTLTGLKANTTYYVRVRAYNTVKKKTRYGTWSKAAKFKTLHTNHTHKWTTKTVVDKKAWNEKVTTRKAYTDYKYTLKGLRDNAYGTFYPVTPKSDTDDAWYDALYEVGKAHAKVAVPYLEAVREAINDFNTERREGRKDWSDATQYVMNAVSDLEPASALAKPVIEKSKIYHPAQTKVIHHDAVTHTETVCRTCGQAKTHTHKWVTRTLIDKGAWDETVVIKEGYEGGHYLESTIPTTSPYHPGKIFVRNLDFIQDIVTQEFYYDSDVYSNGVKLYTISLVTDQLSGKSPTFNFPIQPFGPNNTLTPPYRPEWIPAETEVVHHKAVTHKETRCSICGQIR